MRFKSKLVLVLAGVTVLLNSCKNDLNILAPYKESVSVYALLNPQEKIQYVRINKIFLGEGNAFQMAQVNDSVNYKAGDLSVFLQRYVNGVSVLTTVGDPVKKQITLRDTVINTQSGAFSTTQRLFITSDRLYTSGDYKLIIQNNKTGNEFTSQATICDSVKPKWGYAPIDTFYYPRPIGSPLFHYLDYWNPTPARTVRFYSVPNAREYQVIMRFRYQDSLATSLKVDKYMDMDLGTVSSNELTGNELLSVSFYMSTFYSKLVAELNANQPSNLLFRKAIKMDFIITAVGQEFSDFLKISSPSTSIAQDKPVYSNVNGGFGIFSSRSRMIVSKHISNATIDYIATTKPMCTTLRFLNSAGVPTSICN